MNYVFSWMTLRWKSVAPSTVAHAVWNIFVIGGVNDEFAWTPEVSIVLWTVAAMAVFHCWPPADADSPSVAMPEAYPLVVA
jgi:hypothetical protein